MKTKAVYIIESEETDLYFEQAWVSAWSLKHHNPDMSVTFVVDPDTYVNMHGCYRAKAMALTDDTLMVKVPEEYTCTARSRWMKTTLRKHVKGDYLFLDADTIVCGSLEELDKQEGDVAMVLDAHQRLSENCRRKVILQRVAEVAGREITTDKYYNTGVMLVKDTEPSHLLYDEWNKWWKTGMEKGLVTDQPSFAVAQQKYDIVRQLDDIYHCQVKNSIKYLAEAVVIHFFCIGNATQAPNPFYNDKIYKRIKEYGELDKTLKSMVLTCKSQYELPTYVMSGKEIKIKNSSTFHLLELLNEDCRWLYNIVNNISALILGISSRLSRKKGL